MNPDVLTLIAILTPAVTFGVAYGGTRAAQNGIYKTLSRIEKTGEGNAATLVKHGERLARIETKIEDMPRELPAHTVERTIEHKKRGMVDRYGG